MSGRPKWYDWGPGGPRNKYRRDPEKGVVEIKYYPTWTENGLEMLTERQRAKFEEKELRRRQPE